MSHGLWAAGAGQTRIRVRLAHRLEYSVCIAFHSIRRVAGFPDCRVVTWTIPLRPLLKPRRFSKRQEDDCQGQSILFSLYEFPRWQDRGQRCLGMLVILQSSASPENPGRLAAFRYDAPCTEGLFERESRPNHPLCLEQNLDSGMGLIAAKCVSGSPKIGVQTDWKKCLVKMTRYGNFCLPPHSFSRFSLSRSGFVIAVSCFVTV